MVGLVAALIAGVIITSCNGARILGIAPIPSFSHQVVFRPLWKELSNRGHDVVVITTDPVNNFTVNYTQIDISFTYDIWHQKHKFTEIMKKDIFTKLIDLKELFIDLCQQELEHPGVQKLLNNRTEHFDLVIVEYLLPMLYGFSKRFNCPYIGITSMELTSYVHKNLGNPSHPVAYTDFLMPFDEPKTLFQRFINTFAVYALTLYQHCFNSFNREEAIMKKNYGTEIQVSDIIKNVSMVFINVIPIWSIRPMGPAFINIGGGTHLVSKTELPKDLKKYLDTAKAGAIFFSLGTNVRSANVPPEFIQSVFDGLRELPYKILWKFDKEEFPNLPSNFKIVKWLPQQDVLRHPNVKVFITQGGLQSVEEALYSHVPIVGIPFISDQKTNIKKMVKKGCGVELDINTLTKDSFREAVIKVINNQTYKDNIVELAKLVDDQPMSGLEKAVWWTEYVLRHKGASHLRNPIIDLPFYQYYLLDFVAVMLTILLGTLFIFIKSLTFVNRLAAWILMSLKKKTKSS